MNKKIITKDGQLVLIRNVKLTDAGQIIDVSRSIMAEGLYSSSDPDEFVMSIEQEEKWINDHIHPSGKALFVAEHNGIIIGFINFSNGNRRRNKHVGEFAISIMKAWRNKGIGTSLLSTLIDWATLHPFIEKINLLVFHTNERAIHVYEKLGFEKEGIQKGENKHPDGTYIDDVLMAYWVKSH